MSVLATDDFNRADSGTLGSNWTNVGVGAFSIVSNQCVGTSSAGFQTYTGVSCPDDHYSQVKVISDSAHYGVACRLTDYENGYFFGRADGWFGGSANGRIWKMVAGSYTSLSVGSTAIAANDVIKLEVSGTDLRGYINGSLVTSTTDSSLSTGKFGLRTAIAATFDDWEGGDIDSGSVVLMGQICT